MKLDVLKYCDLVAGGYAIDASELEAALGWEKCVLKPRIELCDGQGWEDTVRFTNAHFNVAGEPIGWSFSSAKGVTLTVYND